MNNILVRFIKTLAKDGLEAFGKYYSCYRAYVVDVNDPENLHRLQLVIPQISGNQHYNYWAFPRNVFAGEGYGSQVLPQKGDVVWVEFEGGHPEVPIWSHGHFSRKEIPEKDKELKDVNCYWFITPKGHKVKLNDTTNTIHIESSLGDVVHMDEKGVKVECTNGKRISLKNNVTSLKDILNQTYLMYTTTLTADGIPLSPKSIQKATDLIKLLNKLLY